MPLSQVKASLKEMLEKTTEKEEIESLAKVIGQVEQTEKEEAESLAKFAELQKSYRDVIINSKFPEPKAKEDTPAPGEDHKEELSFDGQIEKAFDDILNKKEDK